MSAFRLTGGPNHHHAGNGAAFDHMSMHGASIAQYGRPAPTQSTGQAPLPAIAPRPSHQDGQPELVHAPGHALGGYDAAQVAAPVLHGQVARRQHQSYGARYSLPNGHHLTPDEEYAAQNLGVDAATSNIDPAVRQPYNQITPPPSTSFEPRPYPRHSHGGPAARSNSMDEALYAAQYDQSMADPQRPALHQSPPGADVSGRAMNVSAQSVLHHSLQNGWLLNTGRRTEGTFRSLNLAHGFEKATTILRLRMRLLMLIFRIIT